MRIHNDRNRVYQWLGSKEQAAQFWENREALEMYIARLKDFWDEEHQCWREREEVKCKDSLQNVFTSGVGS